MKKNKNTVFRLLTSKKAVLAFTALVFVSVSVMIFAKYFHSSDKMEDVYTPGYYDSPDISVSTVIDGNGFVKKSNIKVAPSEDNEYPVFVRVAIVPLWVNDNGDVLGQPPEKNTDYSISYNQEDWFLWTDGYYYCRQTVKGGSETPALVGETQNVSQIKASPNPEYSMQIEIFTETIQAVGTTQRVGDTAGVSAVLDAWGINPAVH